MRMLLVRSSTDQYRSGVHRNTRRMGSKARPNTHYTQRRRGATQGHTVLKAVAIMAGDEPYRCLLLSTPSDTKKSNVCSSSASCVISTMIRFDTHLLQSTLAHRSFDFAQQNGEMKQSLPVSGGRPYICAINLSADHCEIASGCSCQRLPTQRSALPQLSQGKTACMVSSASKLRDFFAA